MEKHPEVQGPDKKSDLSVGSQPVKPLDYQESNQESRTDQTKEASVRNYSYSSMGREEKIETNHLSTKETQVETVLTVNYQSKESLEIHESGMGEMTDELGEFVNHEVEQANDTCEPSTVAINKLVTDMNQGEEVKGTHPEIRRAYKVSDPTVEDYPVEQIEYHKPCQEERTDQLDTQIRTARIEHYSRSDRNQNEGVESKHLYAETSIDRSYPSVTNHSTGSLENRRSPHELATKSSRAQIKEDDA